MAAKHKKFVNLPIELLGILSYRFPKSSLSGLYFPQQVTKFLLAAIPIESCPTRHHRLHQHLQDEGFQFLLLLFLEDSPLSGTMYVHHPLADSQESQVDLDGWKRLPCTQVCVRSP